MCLVSRACVVISSRCTAPNEPADSPDGCWNIHLWYCDWNRKPVFTFFYIDTDSNKCIFSPCTGWEHLWPCVCVCMCVCVCALERKVHLTYMAIFCVFCLCFYSALAVTSLFLLTAGWRLRCLTEPQERISNDSRLDWRCVCVCLGVGARMPALTLYTYTGVHMCAHRASQIKARFDGPWTAWAHFRCS